VTASWRLPARGNSARDDAGDRAYVNTYRIYCEKTHKGDKRKSVAAIRITE